MDTPHCEEIYCELARNVRTSLSKLELFENGILKIELHLIDRKLVGSKLVECLLESTFNRRSSGWTRKNLSWIFLTPRDTMIVLQPSTDSSLPIANNDHYHDDLLISFTYRTTTNQTIASNLERQCFALWNRIIRLFDARSLDCFKVNFIIFRLWSTKVTTDQPVGQKSFPASNANYKRQFQF